MKERWDLIMRFLVVHPQVVQKMNGAADPNLALRQAIEAIQTDLKERLAVAKAQNSEGR